MMADLSNEAFEQLKADFKASEANRTRLRAARAKAKYEPQPGRAGRVAVGATRQAERAASVTGRQLGRARVGDAPIVPIMLLSVGGYLLWYAVHYFGRPGWPSDPVKAVLQGKPVPPVTGKMTAQYVLSTETGSILSDGTAAGNASALAGAAAGGTTGNAIADDAQQYAGQGYVWGGNASRPGNWDCSSFVSYVLGHDLGLTLPGGGKWGDPGYPPHTHGPTSGTYALWGAYPRVSASQVQPGDLIATNEHIGICIGPGKMISAQDQALGTGVGNFPAGFPGGSPIYRRVPTGGLATGTTQAAGTTTAGGRG